MRFSLIAKHPSIRPRRRCAQQLTGKGLHGSAERRLYRVPAFMPDSIVLRTSIAGET